MVAIVQLTALVRAVYSGTTPITDLPAVRTVPNLIQQDVMQYVDQMAPNLED